MNDASIIAACARTLHVYAFASLRLDPSSGNSLKGFAPGPGGREEDAAPETPAIAHVAAAYIWAKVGPVYASFVDRLMEDDALMFGSDLALTVLGIGAGLYDGDWAADLPADTTDFQYCEGYSYYFGDDVPKQGTTVWAQAKVADASYTADGKYYGGNVEHVACWKLDEYGGLVPAKEAPNGL